MHFPISLFAFFALIFPSFAAREVLFDGKSLDGWEGDAKWWSVQDGLITGGSLERKVDRNYFLATKKSYHNFDLRLQIKITGTEGFINSGVQIRSVRVPNNTEMSGYQVDAGDGWWGKIYDESRRNKVIAEAKDLKAVNAAVKKNDWNEFRIRAEGPRVQSWINGVPALDYAEADPNIAQDGHIGIQVHGGGKALVQAKEITIEELPPTAGAPTWEKVGKPGGKKPKPEGAAAKPVMKEGNVTAGAGPRTAQEQLATFTLPEGLEMELVAAEIPEDGIGKFVAVYFDQKGAMWTMTALEYPVDGNENKAAAEALYASKAKDKILVYDRDPKSPTGFVQKPRVFAEGLAIPLGILPYKDGCYAQHGADIVFLRDTDGDGKADKREVILTGFGVQDSHLFPHQFTRAPGGWIWMAQGAFNYSKVARPDEPPEKAIKFDQTRMAKFRPDGSEFTITSQGPCNIWGLAMNAEGETFIQEANDYGYPVMPFHEFANYPGCSDAQMKSYAPEFPGTAPHFKLGGTGLSGLALTDTDGIYPDAWRDMMLVANPITNRVQGIKMHRDGPYWKLDAPKDFVTTTDPWFRPVALTLAPDGCVYIVDWYNKIISHNEVPRTHPDRDKIRGRIWRVKAKGKPVLEVPDFTKATSEELVAKLGNASTAQHHLAWQRLVDWKQKDRPRRMNGDESTRWQAARDLELKDVAHALNAKVVDETASPPARIGALWVLHALQCADSSIWKKLTIDSNRNIRREAIRALRDLTSLEDYARVADTRAEDAEFFAACKRSDEDPEVRAEMIRSVAALFTRGRPGPSEKLGLVIQFAKEPLSGPTAPSTRNGKPVKVREAYDREFERYLVRLSLEQIADYYYERNQDDIWKGGEFINRYLDTLQASQLSLEGRLLASLSMEPKKSASRVAALLPKLNRAPEKEEILRLMQFLDEPGVADAMRATLANPVTAPTVLNALLELRARLDPAKIGPVISTATAELLTSKDPAQVETGIKLAGAFKLADAEKVILTILRNEVERLAESAKRAREAAESGQRERDSRASIQFSPVALSAVRALSELQSERMEMIEPLLEIDVQPEVRAEALNALAASRAADAPQRLLKLYPGVKPAEQRLVIDKLARTKPGATAIVAAISGGTIPTAQVDAGVLDRLLAVLGDQDLALNALVAKIGSLFRPVLALDGTENAVVPTDLTLEGPVTVETWVKLDEGIGNADGILGAPGQLDLNFYGSQFRVWAGAGLRDVAIAKKKVVADMWTHFAATRDGAGLWKIYIDGELDAIGAKPAAHKIEKAQIGWTGAPGGTKAQFAEFRIWNRERAAEEIRATFDRALPAETSGLLFNGSGPTGWGKLGAGAKVVKSSDLPPVLSAEAAAKLDADFAKFRVLAEKPGNAERGKVASVLCTACHLIGTQGGQIGPNLSGVGAMGTEAILRNILTPNAAMESAYRIYRVEQKDGSVLDAFYVSEDKDAVIIRLPGAADQRIKKTDIRETKFLRRSLMPEGLLEAMAPEQVSDLFAYLKSLK